MEILITIKEKKIRLVLQEKKREIGFVIVADERNLAEKLLPEIDKLIKRNKLIAWGVAKVRVESDQGDNFTTTRIARATAEAWNRARSV